MVRGAAGYLRRDDSDLIELDDLVSIGQRKVKRVCE